MLKSIELLCLVVFVTTFLLNAVCGGLKIVCYHTNWSQYRPGLGKFFPENIDPGLCTHIIYAFAKIEKDRLEPFEWNDLSTDWMKGMYERTTNLKLINPRLKILIAVGGWNAGFGTFSNMVRNEQYRKTFVDTTIDFLLKNKFDGLDIDWEYPGSREGSHPEDKPLFTILVKELRKAFKPHNLVLTAAVGVGEKTMKNAYEIDKIAPFLDFINVMTYDLHGPWEDFLAHQTAFKRRKNENISQSKLNVVWAIDYWIKNGAPREKLILGFALYGRTFTLIQPGKTGLGDTAKGPGTAGPYTRADGILSSYEICTKLSNGWTTKFSEEQKIPYAYSNSEWVAYDNKKSLKIKVDFLLKNRLGGAMFWALDFDDFDGRFCNQGKYPLINFVKSNLFGIPVDPEPVETTAQPDITAASTTLPTTTISSDGRCPRGDGYYPKPGTNCEQFYLCVNSGLANEDVHEFRCPPGLIFDSKSKGCNYADMATCEDQTSKPTTTVDPESTTESTTETTTESTTETTTESTTETTTESTPQTTEQTDSTISASEPNSTTPNDILDQCPNGDGYYILKNTDCKEYYFCAFTSFPVRRVYKYKCTDGRRFDAKSRKCEHVECVEK